MLVKQLNLEHLYKKAAHLKQSLLERDSLFDKLEFLDQTPEVQEFLTKEGLLRTFLAGLTPECEYAIKSIVALKQDSYLFYLPSNLPAASEKLRTVLQLLLQLETFYATMGGIVGYYESVLSLLLQKNNKESPSSFHYQSPKGVDLTIEPSSSIQKRAFTGLEGLPKMGMLFPIGGAGERLGLIEEGSGRALPVACLQFQGHSLLAGLFRDLLAREYLYYKLKGEQLYTPVAIMTSLEKDNSWQVEKICREAKFFGRGKEHVLLFTQPLVPAITEEGNFALSEALEPILKPGGHGVLWKLCEESKVFDWFSYHKRTHALVRQINNPLAALDQGLDAFIGTGIKEEKAFGFASCHRPVGVAEGVNVFFSKEANGRSLAGISNVEYTDFEKKNIQDTPKGDSHFSCYPANTNILFANLEKIRAVVAKAPIPGLLVNMKHKRLCINEKGEKHFVFADRLESTMQNIADFLYTESASPVSRDDTGALDTYITFNHRHKTISTTKQLYKEGSSVEGTPEGALYALLCNWRELLEEFCSFSLPVLPSRETFLKEGAPYLVQLHPALGPFYSVIAQKLRGGTLEKGSVLSLEIAELDCQNISLKGALSVEALSPLGEELPSGKVRFAEEHAGKCVLHNVSIENKGAFSLAAGNIWKELPPMEESVSIVIEGSGEFVAKDLTLKGNHSFVVPHGVRLELSSDSAGKIISRKTPLKGSSWYWKAEANESGVISLTKTH